MTVLLADASTISQETSSILKAQTVLILIANWAAERVLYPVLNVLHLPTDQATSCADKDPEKLILGRLRGYSPDIGVAVGRRISSSCSLTRPIVPSPPVMSLSVHVGPGRFERETLAHD